MSTTLSTIGDSESYFGLKDRILYYLSENPDKTAKQVSDELNLSYKNVNRKINEMSRKGIVEKKRLKYKVTDKYITFFQSVYKNLANTHNEIPYRDKESEFGNIFSHLADESILEEINTKIDLYVAKQLDIWFNKVNQNTTEEVFKIVSTIQKYFGDRKDLKILDVGCGTGRLTFPLSKFFEGIRGIDHNRKYIKYCKIKRNKLRVNIDFRSANIISSKRELKYDVIIIGKINLHNMNDRFQIIKNLKKKLNEGGIIISLELTEKSEIINFLSEFRMYDIENYKNNKLETIEELANDNYSVTQEIVEQENKFDSVQDILEVYRVIALFYQPFMKWTEQDIQKFKEYLIEMKNSFKHDNSYWFTVCKKNI